MQNYFFNLGRDERALPEDGLAGDEVPRGEDALPHVVADRVHDEPAALRRVRLLVVGRGHGRRHSSTPAASISPPTRGIISEKRNSTDQNFPQICVYNLYGLPSC